MLSVIHHELTECLICGKICNDSEWVVFDGLSGKCKCRSCMNNPALEPWAFQFYGKEIYEIFPMLETGRYGKRLIHLEQMELHFLEDGASNTVRQSHS